MFPIKITEICSYKSYCYSCISVLLQTIINVFQYIKILFENWSDMFQTKVVLVSLSIFLLVAAIICIYEAHTEMKVEHHSEIKSQDLYKNEYKKSSSNCGECYYLVNEDDLGCKCTWLFGARRCEKYLWLG